jgi:hypothetical protein
MGAALAEDEESQIQQELEPSGGGEGHAGVKVEARERTTKDPTANHLLSDDRESKNISKVAGSHSLIMRPKKKGKFGPRSASGETGEQHVPAAVQASVDGMGKERESHFYPLGADSDKGNLASLSFGSDTGCLADTYIIVNSEVERKGSLELSSLLRQGAIEEVMLKLEEQFVEREVFFPVFARYFLARR